MKFLRNMKSYVIDGNNLMGKINLIKNQDKQLAREKLVMLIDQYFNQHKAKVYFHFDGFQNTPIDFLKGRLFILKNLKPIKRLRNRSKQQKTGRI